MKTKTYPEIGFLRLRDIIGDESNPGIVPVSRSSWYKDHEREVPEASEAGRKGFGVADRGYSEAGRGAWSNMIWQVN